MSEPQETGIGQKQERIEKPQASSSKPRKVYVLGVAFVAVLLLGASFGIMISATTPNIPTVIEPGSMVGSANYILFQDGATNYAKNAITGQIAYSGTNALTLFNSVIGQLPSGGEIFVHRGNYTFATPLTIVTTGITIRGVGGTQPTTGDPSLWSQPNGTRFYGDVKVEGANTQLSDLSIIGTLYFTSAADLSSSAIYCTNNRLFVYGSIEIIGLVGADASHVPYSITFSNMHMTGTLNRNIITISSLTSAIEHIYFTDSVATQWTGASCIWVSGHVWDVTFLNTLFVTASSKAFLNLTGGGDEVAFRFIACNIEANGASDEVFIKLGSDLQTFGVGVSLVDCWVMRADVFRYVVKDDCSYNDWALPSHKIVFTRFQWFDPTLRFKAGWILPQTLIQFVDCEFPYYPAPTSVIQVSGISIGEFINCRGINPVGLMPTPFSGDYPTRMRICMASSYSMSATPNPNEYNTVADTAVMLTSTGGTGVSINVTDVDGTNILAGALTLTNYYMPLGFSINFGTFSVAPTVTVIGV